MAKQARNAEQTLRSKVLESFHNKYRSKDRYTKKARKCKSGKRIDIYSEIYLSLKLTDI